MCFVCFVGSGSVQRLSKVDQVKPDCLHHVAQVPRFYFGHVLHGRSEYLSCVSKYHWKVFPGGFISE